MNTHWPTKRLGDVFDIARGGSPRPIEKYLTHDADGLNWIKISDASASGKFIERAKEKIKREGLAKTRYVEPGDFLLTNSMSFGRPYIMATDGCIHDGWLVLRPRNNNVVHADYFYHLLGSDEIYNRFVSRAGGSTVKNLNSEIVSSIEVRLPPLSEQRRIAAILDEADDLRRKRKRALELLDGLTQAIFLEMFGDPVSNPKGWSTDTVGSITTKIGSGSTPKGGDASYKTSGISFVRSMNVRDEGFSRKGLAFVDEFQASKLANVALEAGDVLLNITGASVARVCICPADILPARVNQHVAIIRLRDKRLNQFVAASLKMPAMKAKLLGIAESGATRQAITKTQIEELSLPMPPSEQILRFNSATEQYFRIRADVIKSLNSEETLFSSLQHRAFSGQL